MAVCGFAARAESTLDVLVLYTPQVESYYGGVDGVTAHVNSSFASANTAFANSNVSIRLKVRTIEKIEYEESSTDMGDDLDHIATSSEIAALRDEVGADLVCLFRNYSVYKTNSVVYGIAHLLKDEGGNASVVHSVTSAQAAISEFVFQHEVGHNLGGAHDRDNSESGGLYPYSHGHRFQKSGGTQYRTVMAYEPGYGVNYFSNPNVSYNGTPTGVASGDTAADNARGFNEIATAVDGYREYRYRYPVAKISGDLEHEDFNGDGRKLITLDASQSTVENSIASLEWSWLGGRSTETVLTAEFPRGETPVTLSITDELGHSNQLTVTVRVSELSPVVGIATGNWHTLFLQASGKIMGAGSSQGGRLGYLPEYYENRLRPITVVAEGVSAVSAGYEHSLFLKNDGSAWGSGESLAGQLGTGESTFQNGLTQIIASDVTQVAAGGWHSLFLMSDGSVMATGSNGDGQLGDGTFENRFSPVQVMGAGVVSVAAGWDYSLFLKNDGSLWATGRGFSSDYYGKVATPFKLMASGVVSVAAGSNHSLIVKSDGSLWAVGYNFYGQLGDGTTERRFEPVRIMDSGVKAAAVGGSSSLILKTDGSLWQTGLEIFNRKSEYSYDKILSPEMVVAGGVSSVYLGDGYVFYVTEDGTVWAVGRNGSGLLGDGSTKDKLFPGIVLSLDRSGKNVDPIADAGKDVYILDNDGGGERVELDGSGSRDELFITSWLWEWNGLTSSEERFSADFPVGSHLVSLTVTDSQGGIGVDVVVVNVVAPVKVASVVSVSTHSLIVKEDGSLWGAGDNSNGRLGLDETNGPSKFSMIEPSGVVKAATGTYFSLYLMQDGSLWGMGANDSGQLGDGSMESRPKPIQIIDTGVVDIAIGGQTSFFVKSDGSLWGMGYNYGGILGDGTVENKLSPVKIVESDVTGVSASYNYAVFVKSDGSLWATGAHPFKAVDSTSLFPVEVVSAGVKKAAAGGGTCIILKTDGAAWGVGGLWEEDNRIWFDDLVELFPSGAADVVAGSWYYVIGEDGSLWGGGSSLLGKQGVEKYSETPLLQKITYSQVKAVADGGNHALYIRADGSLWGAGWNGNGQMGEQINSSGYATRILNAPSNSADTAPVAVSKGDALVNEVSGTGFQMVVLDGTSSYDDWQIVSWKWSWPGYEASGPLVARDFPSGSTSVKLSVEDVEGNSSEDTFTVTVGPRERVSMIDRGDSHALFMMEDGSLYASGWSRLRGAYYSNNGQYVLAVDSKVRSVAAGGNHSLILLEDGSVWSFGSNNFGQLGDGTRFSRSTPVKVIPDGVVAIAAGYFHSLALKSDGSVWAFGANEAGQLGDGSTDTHYSPVKVMAGGVASISAGYMTSLFVMEDGSLWGCGSNSNYQLAFGVEEHRLSPVEVASGGVALAASDGSHTVFLKDDGTLWMRGGRLSEKLLRLENAPRDISQIISKYGNNGFLTHGGSLWTAVMDVANYGEQPSFKLVHGATVSSFALGNGAMTLREDGSVWESYYAGGRVSRIIEGWGGLSNTAPVADAGPDRTIYLLEPYWQEAHVYLNGLGSSDDWQVASWKWEWMQNGYLRTTTGEYSSAWFPVGETAVTLTVRDDEGLESADEFVITVLDYRDMGAWLLNYYSQGQIDVMSPDMLQADPDGDSISNLDERRFGLDPSKAMNPFTEIQSRIVWHDGKLALKVEPYASGLTYAPWSSVDLLNWKEKTLSSFAQDGALFFEIPENQSQMYRVQVSDPDAN